VNVPDSVARKHEFMTEPPTVAVLGVPEIRIAPTPALPSLLELPPQLIQAYGVDAPVFSLPMDVELGLVRESVGQTMQT